MDYRRILLRVLGLVLLVSGFFVAVSGIVGLGNDAGPIETILMFLGAAALIFLGWLTWDAAGSSQRRSVRRSPDA